MDDLAFLEKLEKENIVNNLLLSTNDWEHFDAYNGTSVVEFKYRKTEYNEYIIEGSKMMSNFHYAETVNKAFYYIVMTPSKVIVWNVSQYIKTSNGLVFDPRRLPVNTEFGGSKKIIKLVHYLHIKDAFKSFQI